MKNLMLVVGTFMSTVVGMTLLAIALWFLGDTILLFLKVSLVWLLEIWNTNQLIMGIILGITCAVVPMLFVGTMKWIFKKKQT